MSNKLFLSGNPEGCDVVEQYYGVSDLKKATREGVGRLLRDVLVTGIWYDGYWGNKGLQYPYGISTRGISNRGKRIYAPERAVFRPSYASDKMHGRGGDLPFPMAMSWLSSGYGKNYMNKVVFPEDVDGTFVKKMQELNVLGGYVLANLDEVPLISEGLVMPIYGTDDLPKEWDELVMNDSEAMKQGNSKRVREVSAFAADYEEINLKEIATEELVEKLRSGLFYLKLNNTENSGEGVKKCFKRENGERVPLSVEELTDLVNSLRGGVETYGLNQVVALQPHVDGIDKNFQIFISPESNDIQILTLSEQFVDDKGSYQSSINAPFEIGEVGDKLQAVIVDMANRYRAKFEAYGFVMCDYIETESGDLKVIDPGLRPTANTATAMAGLWLSEQTGEDFYTSLHFVKTGEFSSFNTFSAPVGHWMSAESAAKYGFAVLPWGYNHLQGAGLMIIAAKSRNDIEEIKSEVTKRIKGVR